MAGWAARGGGIWEGGSWKQGAARGCQAKCKTPEGPQLCIVLRQVWMSLSWSGEDTHGLTLPCSASPYLLLRLPVVPGLSPGKQ